MTQERITRLEVRSVALQLKLEERKADAAHCRRGIEAIASSLYYVARTCPGREWPPGWDRIREIVE